MHRALHGRARGSIALVVCAIPALAAGCALLVGITDREVGGDAGADGGSESSTDVLSDAPVDRPSDAVDAPDTAPDGGDTIAGEDSLADSVADSAADSAADSVADSVADAADSGVDTSVDAGTDAADGGPVDRPCSASAPTVAQTGTASPSTSGGPSLAWDAASSRFGMVWTTSTKVFYQSLSITGAFGLVPTTDVTLPADTGSPPVVDARIFDDPAGHFIVAWGEHTSGGTGNAIAAVRSVAIDGTAGAIVPGTVDPDAMPRQVEGIAYDPTGPFYYTVGRLDAFGHTSWRVDSFTAVPGAKTTTGSTTGASNAAIAYDAKTNVVLVAVIEGATATSAKIYELDPGSLAVSGSQAFATAAAGDTPLDNPGNIWGPSIVATPNNVGVVWLDKHGGSGNADVYLTSLDATSLLRVAAGEVRVNEVSAFQKNAPRIAFDGKAYVVVWMELTSSSQFKVMFQRFDPTTLAPLTTDPPLCISCPTPGDAVVSDVGLAVAGPDSYGVAYVNKGMSQQFFSHVTCP